MNNHIFIMYEDLAEKINIKKNNIFIEIEETQIDNILNKNLVLLKIFGYSIDQRPETKKKKEEPKLYHLIKEEKRIDYRRIFVRNVKREMHRRGIDQGSLSEIFGVTNQSISNVLNGKHSFAVEDIFIFKSLGLELNNLFIGDNAEDVKNIGYDSNISKEINELLKTLTDINSIKEILINVTNILKLSKEVTPELFVLLNSVLTRETKIEDIILLLEKIKSKTIALDDLLNIVAAVEKSVKS